VHAHGDAGAALMYPPALFLLSRLLWWAVEWVQLRKNRSQWVSAMPKEPEPPQAQVVRVAVFGHRPATCNFARALPTELQAVLN
jgi:hypothetical protein